MADDQAGAPAAAKTAPANTAEDNRKKAARGRLFTILGIAVAGVAVLYALYFFLFASHFVSTDDAYVGADSAQVTPLVSGAVKAVRVADTQSVKAGDVLVEIDPADAALAVARADADYQRAVRTVKSDLANTDAMQAQVGARGADIGRAKAQADAARAEVAKAKVDYDRRQALAASGAVSGEELTATKTALTNAQANLAAAEAAAAQAVAQQKGAQAQLIASQVQTAGSVDANFKESQLRKVVIGQRAELESDLYGGHAKYHGKVVGLSGGTGSAFALIPAQNATGNWIKVVQRLPVRIALDPQELAQHPLRVGLSMKAKIDLSSH